jgi:hypothetical protein
MAVNTVAGIAGSVIRRSRQNKITMGRKSAS